jgi:hypothetical protein
MCCSEQSHYNSCNHHVRNKYACTFQKEIHRFDLGCMRLSPCDIRDIQPAKEEQGSYGRCDVVPHVLVQCEQIYKLDGRTSILDSNLNGRDSDTQAAPDVCNTTSILCSDGQGPDPLPTTESPALADRSIRSPNLAQQSLLAILLAHSLHIENTMRPGSLSSFLPIRVQSVGLPALLDASSNRQRSLYYTANSATGLVYMFSAEKKRWHLTDAIGIILSIARAIPKNVLAGVMRPVSVERRDGEVSQETSWQ